MAQVAVVNYKIQATQVFYDREWLRCLTQRQLRLNLLFLLRHNLQIYLHPCLKNMLKHQMMLLLITKHFIDPPNGMTVTEVNEEAEKKEKKKKKNTNIENTKMI